MKRCCFALLILNVICFCGLCIVRAQRDENLETIYKGGVRVSENGENVTPLEEQEEGIAPRIAITFDDGPNPTWTPKLLEGLKERHVKASFFVIGEKAQENAGIIKQMFDEGHTVGNHTFSHVQLTRQTNAEACAEISRTNEVLKEITGEYPEFIRPPFGSWNESLECNIRMFPVMWTIDTLDWTTKNVDKVVKKAVAQAKDNAIILLHDNYESSVEAALRMIDELKKKGFEFVTVEELLVD